MSFSKKASPTIQTKLNTPTGGTSLNPNAAEFVPFSLRPSPGTTNVADAAKFHASASTGKRVLDRSESSISTNSDEEARQYWQQQLPDDITPDFKVAGDDDHHQIAGLSVAGLSLQSGSQMSRFSAALGSVYKMNEALNLSTHHANGGSFGDKMGFPISLYGDDPSSTSYLQRTSKPWEMQLSSDYPFGNGQEGYPFEETTRCTNPNAITAESAITENDTYPVEFLASQFPGFAADSLNEVYFANGCDLNMTIEMLTQLEVCLIALLKLFSCFRSSTEFYNGVVFVLLWLL